ncbi:MAG: hypothetical protein M3323_10505 [Actinomycetota bacterium]|nr:hypothetical protein [Actinomycetota bacterium]
MPCHLCGKVQTDPVRGASPWARGVIAGEQVLVCPDCQAKDRSWTDLLQRCPACSGTRLSIVLGSVVCRECGAQS